MPEKITLDGYAATYTAVKELKESSILPINVCVRTSKYLNNLIEQDHRRVKQRLYPMLGFKRFRNAASNISGIELAHKIKKEQFDTSTVEQKGVRAHQLWEAVPARTLIMTVPQFGATSMSYQSTLIKLKWFKLVTIENELEL